MSIEKDLTRIADALEFIASGLRNSNAGTVATDAPTTAAPAVAKTTTKKKADAVNTPTKEVDTTMIADALRACVLKIGASNTKEILKSFGATMISELKPENRKDCYDKLQEKANA